MGSSPTFGSIKISRATVLPAPSNDGVNPALRDRGSAVSAEAPQSGAEEEAPEAAPRQVKSIKLKVEPKD